MNKINKGKVDFQKILMDNLYWGCRKYIFFVHIEFGSVLFEISAKNDAEWWSSCRNMIDV